MRTRFTRREVVVGGAGTLALAATSARAQRRQAKPNIVFILADDLGYADVSCYGRREYTTTNIGRLAQSGMRLLHAYSNSAVCSATRTALITGRYQYRYPIGLEEPLNGRDVGLPPAVPTLPSLLTKAGYATALIGKWHLGQPPKYTPQLSGYEHFYGIRGGRVRLLQSPEFALGRARKGERRGLSHGLVRRPSREHGRVVRARGHAVSAERAFQCAALAVGGT